VRVEFLHGKGRTDMTTLMVTFHSSVKAPKNDVLGKTKKSVICFLIMCQNDLVCDTWILNTQESGQDV
jgi:hypothetical protein